MEYRGKFREKPKEWKERIECKLQSWLLDLTLPLTDSMNLSKSFTFSASVFLPAK